MIAPECSVYAAEASACNHAHLILDPFSPSTSLRTEVRAPRRGPSERAQGNKKPANRMTRFTGSAKGVCSGHHADAVFAAEWIRLTSVTFRIIHPLTIDEESVFVGLWFQGQSGFP